MGVGVWTCPLRSPVGKRTCSEHKEGDARARNVRGIVARDTVLEMGVLLCSTSFCVQLVRTLDVGIYALSS